VFGAVIEVISRLERFTFSCRGIVLDPSGSIRFNPTNDRGANDGENCLEGLKATRADQSANPAVREDVSSAGLAWCNMEPVSGRLCFPHPMELGRLGLKVEDIANHGGSSHSGAVLSELLDWMSAQPSAAYAKLCDWRFLDFDQLRKRLKADRDAKPRIEISASITKKDNLSVRWHPGGWRDSEVDWLCL
jgi:hypothetical protein